MRNVEYFLVAQMGDGKFLHVIEDAGILIAASVDEPFTATKIFPVNPLDFERPRAPSYYFPKLSARIDNAAKMVKVKIETRITIEQ